MKIKSGFLLRTIAGSHIVVPVGNRSQDFNGMMTLNDTAAFLWKQLEQGATEEELVQALLQNYENAEEETCRRNVAGFLAKLREVNCLE